MPAYVDLEQDCPLSPLLISSYVRSMPAALVVACSEVALPFAGRLVSALTVCIMIWPYGRVVRGAASLAGYAGWVLTYW